MGNFFGVEIDTENMTLEELETAREKTHEMLRNISWQIEMRKISKHKHSSGQ